MYLVLRKTLETLTIFCLVSLNMHYVKRIKAKEAFSVTKYMYCAEYIFFVQSPVFEDNYIIFSIEYKAVSKYCLLFAQIHSAFLDENTL